MTIKTDFSGLLNSDVAPQKLQPTEYVNLQNMRIGSTDKGRTGQLESVSSAIGITNPYLPAGNNLSNGSCEDAAKQRFFEFLYNDAGNHAIFCYDGTTVYKVLLSSQVEGGLNLNKDFYIHSAEIVGNLLIWTDNNEEQKCINVEAGIKLNHSTYVTTEAPYVTPIKYTTTTLIKRPPIFPLTWSKSTDAGYPNNFIAKNAYQFAYRFRYRDYQTSVLSAYSKLVPFNANTETFNKITVTVPTTEYIDDDIFAVDICVKYGNFGKTFIIKSWDKDSDLTAITAHNAGTSLTFNFYDDLVGEALDDVSANTPFDSVPLLSQTLSVAKNRLYLGGNLFGYNTPSKSSLTSVINPSGAGETYTGAWGYVVLTANYGTGSCSSATYKYPFVYSAGAPHNFYFFGGISKDQAYSGDISSFLSTTANASDAVVAKDTELDFVNALKAILFPFFHLPPTCVLEDPTWLDAYTIDYTIDGTAYPITISDISSGFFKSASTYKISIAFFDRFRRKCGITKQVATNYISERTYSQTSFSATLQWFLSNTDAINEIPDWAYYYQIHITKNQTTRYFLQARTTGADYVTKLADGTLSYSHTDFVIGTTYATAINISTLTSFGLGYTFTKGDLIRIGKSDDTNVLLTVIGTDGNFVLCSPKDIGTLDTTTVFLVELFTPYKALTIEPYYETGSVYTVSNPGTADRSYSILTGVIKGDCYSIQRKYDTITNYVTEAMSPNDLVWQVWQTDTGWPNQVDTIGQKLIKGSIAFSDTYIEGTKVNGLSSFQPLNTDNISIENGALRKLILTSKTQAEGSIMLAICEEETLSVYLGESVLTSSTGQNTAIATSSNTIGQINALKGGYGTINPESVVEYRGEVYWFDANAGCWVFYSVNGIHSLNKGKTERFAKLYSDKYKSLTAAEIEALGNRPLIIGGVDIYHKEILWSIPKVGTNPNGTITDTGMDYPYDLLDYQGKTIVFKGAFLGSYSYNAESFVSIGNKLFYFYQGNIFECNQTSIYNNFSGVQQKARIMFAINAEPSTPKVLSGISVESNVCPDYIHFRSEYPDIQSSDLVAADFTEKEGIYYASALRDRLSPNTTGTYDEKLFKGDKVRGTYIYCLIEFWTSELVQLKAVNVSFVDSIGHRV